VFWQILNDEMLEVVGSKHSLSAAARDKPPSPCLTRRPAEKEAQEIFELFHDEVPFEESAPADDAVEVRRVGGNRVEAPTPAFADVGASKN
jgi:hypothetical protein